MSPEGARRGLQLGLAAFLLLVLSALFPPLFIGYLLVGVAAMAVLYRDARYRSPAATRAATLGLMLVVAGMLTMVVANALSARAFVTDDEALRRAAAWMGAAGDIGAAAGFYTGVGHLALSRSRLLLGLAFGAAAMVALMTAFTGGQGAVAMAQGVPYILFGWAWATILGRLGKPDGEAGAHDAPGR